MEFRVSKFYFRSGPLAECPCGVPFYPEMYYFASPIVSTLDVHPNDSLGDDNRAVQSPIFFSFNFFFCFYFDLPLLITIFDVLKSFYERGTEFKNESDFRV